MRLNVYEAKTFDSSREGLINKLKQNMLDKNARHIVLVPERFTMSGEKIIYNSLGISGCDNLEISSFSRLAERNVDEHKKYLSPAGSLMLFTKAVLSCEGLVKYKNCRKMSGFYKEMFAVISAFRDSGIKADELTKLKLPNLTKLKLNDIAVLYNSYTKLLSENYYDATSLYEEFADIIADKSLFADCYFYIVDYYFFSQVQINIIKQLASVSKGVYINLPINNSKNERIYPFTTETILNKVASEIGDKLNIERVSTKLQPEFNHICDNMYSYEKCDKLDSDKIEIYSSDTIDSEVELACVKIKQGILSGKRYNDFAVVVGSINDYAPIIKKQFVKHNIPFFIDKKESLIMQAGTRFLLDSLKAVDSNFDKEFVMKIACNPYSNITSDMYDDFDNFVVKYGISYMFNKPFDIGEDDILYKNAEYVREKITKPLKIFKACDKNSEYVALVKEYLKNVDFLGNTNNFMDSQVKFNNEFYLPITKQMYDKIYAILDEYNDILGSETSSFTDFIITIENMISDIDIGLVPVYVDCVYIGEAKESMYESMDTMIVLGANQSVIPSYQADATILSNNDIDAMQKNDVYISPTPKSNNNDAMFYIMQILVKPYAKLIVSYNESSGLAPSEIIRELKTLFNISEKRFDFNINSIYKNDGEEKLQEVLPSLVSTKANLKDILIKDLASENNAIESDKPYSAMISFLDENEQEELNKYIVKKEKQYTIENGEKLFFHKNSTSISELEQYFSCPYMHFMNYGLSLKDREEAKADQMDIGIIIHAVLEQFFKRVTNFDITDEKVESIVKDILVDVFSDSKMKSKEKNNKQLINKIKKECIVTCQTLVKRQQKSSFVPFKLEYGFGYDGKSEIIVKVHGKDIKFKGKIDRIDKYEDRIMIIDYKTGNISKDLSDVYSGKKIQLYMYLSALLKQNKMYKPAGVYYQQIKVKYRKDSDKDKRFVYVGQTNADKKVIQSIDNTLEDNLSSELIDGIKFNKTTGVLSSNSDSNCLTDENFLSVCDYVQKLSAKACEQILEGNILASPYGSDCKCCEYCGYKGVCGFNKNTGREVKQITKEKIIEASNE